MQRRIGLQIDDLAVDRYLAIPEIALLGSTPSASPPQLSSARRT
jgi:hypothetical protein